MHDAMKRSSTMLRIAACVAFTVLFASSPASAQSHEARREAADLARRAQEAYRQGRFAASTELIEQALELYPEPALYYNLGRSRESGGDSSGAIEAYESYLSEAGDAPNRAQVEARLATLRRQVREREELEAAAERPERDDEDGGGAVEPVASETLRDSGDDARGGPSVLPWIVTGVGVAVVGVGIGFGVASENEAERARSAPDHQTAYPLAQSSEDLASAANIAFVVGGAIALAGVIWGVIDLASGGGDDPPGTVRF